MAEYVIYHDMLSSLFPFFKGLPFEMKNELMKNFISDDSSDDESSLDCSDDSDVEMVNTEELQQGRKPGGVRNHFEKKEMEESNWYIRYITNDHEARDENHPLENNFNLFLAFLMQYLSILLN